MTSIPVMKDRFFELHGRNEVSYVRSWGWTNSFALDFPGLRPDLCMSTLKGDKELPPGATGPPSLQILEECIANGEKIKWLATRPEKEYIPIDRMLVVQIVAKKKSEIIWIRPRSNGEVVDGPQSALVIGQLIVADQTGFCIVTLINESVCTIHDKVQVGDFLIIKKSQARHLNIEGVKPFPYPYQNLLINVEIKIEKYSTRYVTHVRAADQKFWKPLLPKTVFSGGWKLFSPSDILDKIASGDIEDKKYLDVIGVISYVGRIELKLIHRSNAVLEQDDQYKVTLRQNIRKDSKVMQVSVYVAYRWIILIDKTGRALRVQIYITKDNLESQDNIVPGSIVLITHCNFESIINCFEAIKMTSFSQIYLNDAANQFYNLIPHQLIFSTLEDFSFPSYEFILKSNLKWSAGGTLYFPLPTNFLELYKTAKDANFQIPTSSNALIYSVPKNYSFSPGENVTVTFRGRIMLVHKILEKDLAVHTTDSSLLPGLRPITSHYTYGNAHEIEMQMQQRPANAQCFIHPREHCLCSSEKCIKRYRDQYSHELPMPFPLDQGIKDVSGLSLAMVQHFQPFCTALLLPGFIGKDQSNLGTLPDLGKLPIASQTDHYRLTIRDEDTGDWYEGYWRTFSMKEMEIKCKNALGKIIVGEINIFKPSMRTSLEVIIRDFVTERETEAAYEPDPSQRLEMGQVDAQMTRQSEENFVERELGANDISSVKREFFGVKEEIQIPENCPELLPPPSSQFSMNESIDENEFVTCKGYEPPPSSMESDDGNEFETRSELEVPPPPSSLEEFRNDNEIAASSEGDSIENLESCPGPAPSSVEESDEDCETRPVAPISSPASVEESDEDFETCPVAPISSPSSVEESDEDFETCPVGPIPPTSGDSGEESGGETSEFEDNRPCPSSRKRHIKAETPSPPKKRFLRDSCQIC